MRTHMKKLMIHFEYFLLLIKLQKNYMTHFINEFHFFKYF